MVHGMQYLIQFTAGTGDLLRAALVHQFGGLEVRYRDDSAMIIESSVDPEDVAAIPFIKNAFVVIAETERRSSVDKGIAQFGRIAGNADFRKIPGKIDKFRVVVHIDGSLVPIDPRARATLERAVAGRTGARLEPRGMCQEYWVVGRQGLDRLVFCARLAKARRPDAAKGAVSPELSAMLVAASGPGPRDVFLDPFGGSGSFVAARLEQPVGQVWYSDLDLERHRKVFPRQLTANKRMVRLLAEDALTLPSIGDGSVDVIVTDPPWGEFETMDMPFEEFARAVGRSFARVLHPARGRFVVLVNRRNAQILRDALRAAGLPPNAAHEILVNGHPATVLVGGRAGR